MKLPLKLIKLGHQDLLVRDFTDNEHPNYKGFFYPDIAEIALNLKSFKTNQSMLNTLLHEILHAVWKNKGLETEDDEEACVLLIANGLIEVFKRNPELVQVFYDEFV